MFYNILDSKRKIIFIPYVIDFVLINLLNL